VKIKKGGLYKKGRNIYLCVYLKEIGLLCFDNINGKNYSMLLCQKNIKKELKSYKYLGQAKDLLKVKK